VAIDDVDLHAFIEESRRVNEAFAAASAASPLDFSSAEAARRTRKLVAEASPYGAVTSSDAAVEEAGVPAPAGDVPVRIVRPATIDAVYLQAHGGGFVVGSAEANDGRNVRAAQECGIAVVSVEYRMAPEHPFPAFVDDFHAVARWLLDESDATFGTRRLLIGGESAGATLAVQTLLRLRDEGADVARFAGANLVYGSYDMSGTPSVRRGTGAETLDSVYALVYPGRDAESRRDPSISPLYADLRGLPPALFTVGALDDLLDDSLFMHSRWTAAGNEADIDVYPESLHGFDVFPTKLAEVAANRMHAFLRARASWVDRA
jgi:acetyl esterase/lipase